MYFQLLVFNNTNKVHLNDFIYMPVRICEYFISYKYVTMNKEFKDNRFKHCNIIYVSTKKKEFNSPTNVSIY